MLLGCLRLDLPCPSRSGDICAMHPTFAWILEIPTQVLIFVRQTLLPNKHLTSLIVHACRSTQFSSVLKEVFNL